jgi:hypothetical protein
VPDLIKEVTPVEEVQKESKGDVEFLGSENEEKMNPLTLLIKHFGFEVFRGLLKDELVEIAKGTAANIQKLAFDHFSTFFKKIEIENSKFYAALITDTNNAQLVQFYGSMKRDPATLRSIDYLSSIMGNVPTAESYSSYRVPEIIKYFEAVGDTVLAHDLKSDRSMRLSPAGLSKTLQIGDPKKVTEVDKKLLAAGWEFSFHTFCESFSGGAVSYSREKDSEGRFMLTQRTSSGLEYLRTWSCCCIPENSIFLLKLMILRDNNGVIKDSKIEFRKYIGNPDKIEWEEIIGVSFDDLILFIPYDYKSGQQDYVFLGRKLEKAIEKSVETI